MQITGGAGKTTNDFVEIYNPTDQDVDLQGMRLVKRTKTGTADTLIKSWTDSTTIKAHGFYLWANSDFVDIAAAADVITSGTIADDNGIALRSGPNDTGTIIDSVAWGAAANAFMESAVFASNPPANQSLERSPGADLGNSNDTNNNATDFFLQTAAHPRNSQSPAVPVLTTTPPPPEQPPPPAPEPPPSPEPEPPPPPPPPAPIVYSKSIFISEFLANPSGKDPGKEWVELINVGSSEVDLSGWILDDEGPAIGSSAYVFPSGVKIGSKQYLVQILPEASFDLDNTNGDTVRLFWPDGSLAAEVSFTADAEEEVTLAQKNDGSFAWSRTPTPGKANSFIAVEKVEPVKQTEETPTAPVQTVTVNGAAPGQETSVQEEATITESVEPASGQIAGEEVTASADPEEKSKFWKIFAAIVIVLLVILLYIYFRFLK